MIKLSIVWNKRRYAYFFVVQHVAKGFRHNHNMGRTEEVLCISVFGSVMKSSTQPLGTVQVWCLSIEYEFWWLTSSTGYEYWQLPSSTSITKYIFCS